MVHYVKLSLLASSNSMALPWPGGLAGRVAMSGGVGGGGVGAVVWGVCASVAVWVRWTEGVGGGGARARFIISRLIAPVQEKSGSLGNRMPFSFNCQPPRTVNPPQVLHQRDPRGPTPAHQQRRAAVSYCTRITGQRRMRGACTQRHLMAPEEAGKRAPAAARSTSVCSLGIYTKLQISAVWPVLACCGSCY